MPTGEEIERLWLPYGTPDFVTSDPLLWSKNHRFTIAKMAMDCFYLLGCAPLLFRAFARQPPNHVLATSRILLRVLASLYAFDVVFSMATGSLSLWIVSHLAMTSEQIYRVYINAYTATDSVLCIVHAGIVLLVAEVDPIFWGAPHDKKRPRWLCTLFCRWCYFMGWHLAFCLSALRLSLAFTTQFPSFGHVGTNEGLQLGHDVVIENMLKIMLFLSGFLLLLPFHFVVNSWIWGNVAVLGTAAAYRFAVVVENRGPDEMTPHWISLFIDIFFSRVPTLLVLNMFASLLYTRRKR